MMIVRKGLYPGRTRCMCMSVELPFAPVDTIIRGKAGELRVSAGAAEELARRIQAHGATLAVTAAEKAAADDRKTLMAADFGVQQVVSRRELELPIAPIDRIARLRIDNRYRVSMDARIALADILEDYANNVANAAAILARHADRRTIQAEDIETYFQLFE
jgi:histone H3/H4